DADAAGGGGGSGDDALHLEERARVAGGRVVHGDQRGDDVCRAAAAAEQVAVHAHIGTWRGAGGERESGRVRDRAAGVRGDVQAGPVIGEQRGAVQARALAHHGERVRA